MDESERERWRIEEMHLSTQRKRVVDNEGEEGELAATIFVYGPLLCQHASFSSDIFIL